MNIFIIIIIGFIVLSLLMFYWMVNQFIKCPPDKLLVIFGRVEDANENGMKVLNGGAAFVWPVIQDHEFIDLTPYDYKLSLKLTTKDLISVVLTGNIAYGVSNRPDLMNAAAERLLGIDSTDVQLLASNIIQSQLTELIGEYDLVDLAVLRNQIIDKIATKVHSALNKLGMELKSIKIDSVKDKDGLIKQLEQIYSSKTVSDFNITTPSGLVNDLAKIEEAITLNAQERQKLIIQKVELLVKNKANK